MMEVYMRRSKYILLGIVIILLEVIVSGCKAEETSLKKIKDLEFTVVEDTDVPEELKKIIEEKKSSAFKLSFSDSDYLYIVVGYGEQATGGYSISVDELYLTENAIYIGTTLLGPSKDEHVTQALTYPYIVVKTEFMDKSVVFN
jgi:hypothetical protein